MRGRLAQLQIDGLQTGLIPAGAGETLGVKLLKLFTVSKTVGMMMLNLAGGKGTADQEYAVVGDDVFRWFAEHREAEAAGR